MKHFATLILFAASCLSLLSAESEIQFKKVTVEGRTCYIVPKEYAEQPDSLVRAQLSGNMPKGQYDQITFWTPSPDEVAEAEKAAIHFIHEGIANPKLAFPRIAAHPEGYIPEALESSRKDLVMIDKIYGKYIGQFVGIAYGQDRRVYCSYFFLENAFHSDFSKLYACVSDGGYAVWQIDYDLRKKCCLDIQVNGG